MGKAKGSKIRYKGRPVRYQRKVFVSYTIETDAPYQHIKDFVEDGAGACEANWLADYHYSAKVGDLRIGVFEKPYPKLARKGAEEEKDE